MGLTVAVNVTEVPVATAVVPLIVAVRIVDVAAVAIVRVSAGAAAELAKVLSPL